MRKNIVNREEIEGRLYDFDLTVKEVQNQASTYFGKPFISGTVSIATDDEGLNVIDVHYTFITEITANNKNDSRYPALKRIMETGKTWVKDGKDMATKLKINSAAALNDFYPQGGDELVSQQRNESGFITFLSTLCPDGINRHKFIFDAVINRVDVREPENAPVYAQIRCAIFNFRKDILPFTLIARDSGAIDYFESLGVNEGEPVFTQVWGEIVNTTQKIEREIESAWGAPQVEYSERTAREWVVTGARPDPYGFGDETNITEEEINAALAKRNVDLEVIKTRAKQYYAEHGNAIQPAPAPTNAVPQGKFNF